MISDKIDCLLNYELSDETSSIFIVDIGVNLLNNGSSFNESFNTENKALARVEYINNKNTNKFENIGSYELGEYYDKDFDLFKNEDLISLEKESTYTFKEWYNNFGAKDVSLDTSLVEFEEWAKELINEKPSLDM